MTNPIKENAIKILIALFENNPNEELKFDGNDIVNYTKLSPNEINNAIEYLDEQGFLNRKDYLGTYPFKFGDVYLNSKGNFYYHEIKNAQETEDVKETIVHKQTMDIFISHSSNDREIAKTLIELIRKAFNISSEKIRCTSVPGYKLKAGANTDEQLKKEIFSSKAFIGLITSKSIHSTYVLFELGARWGADLPLIPLICDKAGVSLLDGPIKNINALSIVSQSDIHQFLHDLGDILEVESENPSGYSDDIQKLNQLVLS